MSPRNEEGTSQMDDKDRGLTGPIDRAIRTTQGNMGGLGERALRPAIDVTSALNLTPIRVPGSAPGTWTTKLTGGRRSWITDEFIPISQASSGLPAPNGPPWLFGYVLYSGTTEEMDQLIRSNLFDFDEVTSRTVVITYIGDPRETGPAYEMLRDDQLRTQDEAGAPAYDEMIRAGTADYHRRRQVFELRKRLGITRAQLPCIVFFTDPPCTSPALLRIRPTWLANESARHEFVVALIDFFETAGIDQLARTCSTNTELTRKFEGMINKHMVDRLRLERGDDAAKDLHVFEKQGRTWLLLYEGVTTSVEHSVGMFYIAELLAAPERQLHAADLLSTVSRDGRVRLLGSAGNVADGRALKEYRAKLQDLQEEILDAEANNDAGRAEKLKKDFAVISAEIERATGLRGRLRKACSDRERVRQSVSRAIHRALLAIKKEHEPLWQHLRNSLKIGGSLSYQPGGRTFWTL
jgi:hypothetical protein